MNIWDAVENIEETLSGDYRIEWETINNFLEDITDILASDEIDNYEKTEQIQRLI